MYYFNLFIVFLCQHHPRCNQAGMLAWNDTRHLNAVEGLIIQPARSDARIMLQSFALFVLLNPQPVVVGRSKVFVNLDHPDLILQLVALSARKTKIS